MADVVQLMDTKASALGTLKAARWLGRSVDVGTMAHTGINKNSRTSALKKKIANHTRIWF
jgi:hypothetical protein